LSTWDREASLAVSKEFDIDEVEAAILVRSFLYHESVLAGKDDSRRGTPEEVPDAIASFYNSERIDAFRVFLPLFRANASGDAPLTDIAIEALPEMIPDGPKFAEEVIAEYIRKSKARVPERLAQDVKKAALWAKQNLKEQLALLEVLYWCMWDYTPCTGPLVVQIYETAYSTNLGSVQANSTLLLDDECSQLLQDIAALWILATLEVLELERVGDPRELRISGDQPRDIYWLYPDALLRLHEIVTSHTDSQFSCSYAAWSYFLSRFVALCDSAKDLPQEYLPFYEAISPPIDRTYSKLRDPAYILMANAVMQPEAGLLRLLLTLLTGSSLLVTSVAWKTGSSVTDPNAIAYRSVLKGADFDSRWLPLAHNGKRICHRSR
jgi:nuclear pore complex protein Nup188